jgi:hypothetical protein
MPQKLKKSETLEIRLPHPAKQAFMARCRADDRSASEVLRDLIEDHMQAPRRTPAKPERKGLRLVLGVLIAAAVGAAAAPSLAALPAAGVRDLILKTGFQRLDANHDGQVSFDEYRRAYEAAAR